MRYPSRLGGEHRLQGQFLPTAPHPHGNLLPDIRLRHTVSQIDEVANRFPVELDDHVAGFHTAVFRGRSFISQHDQHAHSIRAGRVAVRVGESMIACMRRTTAE